VEAEVVVAAEAEAEVAEAEAGAEEAAEAVAAEAEVAEVEVAEVVVAARRCRPRGHPRARTRNGCSGRGRCRRTGCRSRR
jgi:hypothetical protein